MGQDNDPVSATGESRLQRGLWLRAPVLDRQPPPLRAGGEARREAGGCAAAWRLAPTNNPRNTLIILLQTFSCSP